MTKEWNLWQEEDLWWTLTLLHPPPLGLHRDEGRAGYQTWREGPGESDVFETGTFFWGTSAWGNLAGRNQGNKYPGLRLLPKPPLRLPLVDSAKVRGPLSLWVECVPSASGTELELGGEGRRSKWIFQCAALFCICVTFYIHKDFFSKKLGVWTGKNWVWVYFCFL